MSKQTVVCGLFLVLGGLAVGSCRKADEPAIARVGSYKITASDLRTKLESAPLAYQQYGASPEGRRQFLTLLIREKILLEEAKSMGIPRDKSYKEALIRYQKDAQVRQQDYENTLLVESAFRRLRSDVLAVSDSDVEKYYNDNRAQYDKPILTSASHILLNTEAAAQKALMRLKKEPFERVAKEMSMDPATAMRGGKLTAYRPGMLVPEFEAAAAGLKIGAVSGPVKTQFGFHIIKKLGEKALPPRSLPEVKEEIREKLERTKFEEWVSARQASLRVEVDEPAVAQVSVEEPLKP